MNRDEKECANTDRILVKVQKVTGCMTLHQNPESTPLKKGRGKTSDKG